jgi:hypothetical protein
MLHVRWKVGSESLFPSLDFSHVSEELLDALRFKVLQIQRILSAEYNVMLVQLLNPQH